MVYAIRLQSICRVLGHQRSKRKARPLATTWSSECRVCGQRIVRIKRKRWILARNIHQHAAALYGPAFARAWPVDQSFCFNELLQAIDTAAGNCSSQAKSVANTTAERQPFQGHKAPTLSTESVMARGQGY